jgi:hypothetical protein
MGYVEWINTVKNVFECNLRCKVREDGIGDLLISCRTFNGIIWTDRVSSWLVNEWWSNRRNATAFAYFIISGIKEDWWKVIRRKDESDD